jgi:hypothetical protein
MAGDRTEVEMHACEGLPTITVKINGRGPYLFGIDTGAQGLAHVSARLAGELGLIPVGEILTGDPSGGNARAVPVYRLGTLQLGGLTFSGVEVPELSFGEGIDGMLGLELFEEFVLTLDYGRAHLIAARGELPAPNGETILNYTPGPGGSVQIPIRIGALETAVNLDTGAGRTGLALPPEKLAQVPIHSEPRVIGTGRTASQEFEIKLVELAAPVAFGAVTLPVTAVTFPSPDPVGVLGSEALRAMVVTIDQRTRRVRIVPNHR